MSKFITMPQVGIIIDGIYRNYSKPKFEQKNATKLAVDCGVSTAILLKVRNILASMTFVVVDGERAQQKCYWNPTKSKPNPVMLTEVYRAYTKDAKSRVKVEKKERRLPSKELALQALAKTGCVRITLEYIRGNGEFTERYKY